MSDYIIYNELNNHITYHTLFFPPDTFYENFAEIFGDDLPECLAKCNKQRNKRNDKKISPYNQNIDFMVKYWFSMYMFTCKPPSKCDNGNIIWGIMTPSKKKYYFICAKNIVNESNNKNSPKWKVIQIKTDKTMDKLNVECFDLSTIKRRTYSQNYSIQFKQTNDTANFYPKNPHLRQHIIKWLTDKNKNIPFCVEYNVINKNTAKITKDCELAFHYHSKKKNESKLTQLIKTEANHVKQVYYITGIEKNNPAVFWKFSAQYIFMMNNNEINNKFNWYFKENNINLNINNKRTDKSKNELYTLQSELKLLRDKYDWLEQQYKIELLLNRRWLSLYNNYDNTKTKQFDNNGIGFVNSIVPCPIPYVCPPDLSLLPRTYEVKIDKSITTKVAPKVDEFEQKITAAIKEFIGKQIADIKVSNIDVTNCDVNEDIPADNTVDIVDYVVVDGDIPDCSDEDDDDVNEDTVVKIGVFKSNVNGNTLRLATIEKVFVADNIADSMKGLIQDGGGITDHDIIYVIKLKTNEREVKRNAFDHYRAYKKINGKQIQEIINQRKVFLQSSNIV